MKIRTIKITLEPSHFAPDRFSSLRMEVEAGGIKYNTEGMLEVNDFDPMFDVMVEKAIDEIKRLVRDGLKSGKKSL